METITVSLEITGNETYKTAYHIGGPGRVALETITLLSVEAAKVAVVDGQPRLKALAVSMKGMGMKPFRVEEIPVKEIRYNFPRTFERVLKALKERKGEILADAAAL